MNDSNDLEDLLTPLIDDSPQTFRGFNAAKQTIADSLADAAATLQPDDPRRPGLLAAAVDWHRRTTERVEPTDDPDPFAWAVDLLLDAGLIDP